MNLNELSFKELMADLDSEEDGPTLLGEEEEEEWNANNKASSKR